MRIVDREDCGAVPHTSPLERHDVASDLHSPQRATYVRRSSHRYLPTQSASRG